VCVCVCIYIYTRYNLQIYYKYITMGRNYAIEIVFDVQNTSLIYHRSE